MGKQARILHAEYFNSGLSVGFGELKNASIASKIAYIIVVSSVHMTCQRSIFTIKFPTIFFRIKKKNWFPLKIDLKGGKKEETN